MYTSGEHKTTGRILDIIEILSEHREGMTFTEISNGTEVPKGSLHPLLMTLCQRHYINYAKEYQKYFMGEMMFVIGNKYVEDVDILQLIRDEMHILSEKVKETVFFGVLSGGDVLYLLKVEAESANIRLVSQLGYKWSAYGTGFGKALLSQYNIEQLKMLYPEGLKPITPHTITSFETLAIQCEETRRSGFAYESEESTPHVRCVAVPIKDGDEYLAGMSVAVPVFRYSNEKEVLIKTEMATARKKIEKILHNNRAQWIYS